MADEQPFHMLFETFGRTPLAHAESVNREAHDQLVRWLDVPISRDGGCILLRAPRAGHGKTHLLSRIRHRFHATHEAILLRASRGYQIDASTVLEDVVRHLLEEQPGHRGLTRMDVLARRTMASALVPLVESGEVPCEDKQAAIDALRRDPLGTFDFHNPAAVTAQWAKESFSALSERLLPHLARACDLPGREINFWLQALYHHSSASLEDHRRHQILEDKVRSNAAGEAGMMNRLEALLALMSLGKRVVLIADDLEGFSSDQGAALSLATLIMALRQSVPRLDVLVSLNRDVWEGVFVPCLSDGLADRLSERLVELRALSESEMLELLESRAPGRGSIILASIDRDKAGTHARGLIREAAAAWDKQDAPTQSALEAPAEPPSHPSGRELKQMPSSKPPQELAEPDFSAPAADSGPAIEADSQNEQPAEPSSDQPERAESEELERAEAAPEQTQTPAEPRPSPFVVESEVEAAEPEPLEPEVAAPEPAVESESRLEDPVSSLDPEDRARVEDLLKQFREKFGQSGGSA